VADVLVLPSDLEPHGDVIKEGMCFGLPAVVSDRVGAAADVVEHGENGYIYPCGDWEALAKRLEELASDDNRREVMGRSADRTAKEWDHEITISSLIKTLNTVLKRES